jgi:hypothetical protein
MRSGAQDVEDITTCCRRNGAAGKDVADIQLAFEVGEEPGSTGRCALFETPGAGPALDPAFRHSEGEGRAGRLPGGC